MCFADCAVNLPIAWLRDLGKKAAADYSSDWLSDRNYRILAGVG